MGSEGSRREVEGCWEEEQRALGKGYRVWDSAGDGRRRRRYGFEVFVRFQFCCHE